MHPGIPQVLERLAVGRSDARDLVEVTVRREQPAPLDTTLGVVPSGEENRPLRRAEEVSDVEAGENPLKRLGQKLFGKQKVPREPLP